MNRKKRNRLSQYRCQIDGIDVHFVHERGKGPSPLPLILTHGWPDSYLRYQKIIPLLTDPASYGGDPADAFDVIVPSLPGFGFSGRPAHAGAYNFRVAEMWAKLMTEELGYDRFGAAGGDIGSGVTRYLASSHPGQLVGIHRTD
ncbi:epoxide hydrolase [Paenibacillus polymyxa]|uniref:epoxide hydrolase family protein n=1 Tax=Paenibacillus polymyxa TaxID=1406 RepID=UPI00287F6638|nr:epoxide hydrolase [Paenibacillus polymyxa]